MTDGKLYLVTRSDLPFAEQAVQAAHALRQFVHEQPEADAAWFRGSNVLVLLAAAGETQLRALLEAAAFEAIPCCGFQEPDRGFQLTAVALGPSHACRRLTQGLEFEMGAVPTCSPPYGI